MSDYNAYLDSLDSTKGSSSIWTALLSLLGAGLSGLGTDTDVMIDTGLTSGDFININPYTEDYYNTLTSMLEQYGTSQQDATTAMQNYIENMDTSDWVSQAFSLLGSDQLSSLVADWMKPYVSSSQSYADQAADKAKKSVAQSYSGGNLYSGGFGSAVTSAVGDIYSEAAMNEASLQSSLLGSMGSQLFSGSIAASEAESQNTLSALASLLSSSSSGLGSVLSGLGSVSQAEYYNPYVANPDYGSSTGTNFISTLIQLIPAIGTLFGT